MTHDTLQSRRNTVFCPAYIYYCCKGWSCMQQMNTASTSCWFMRLHSQHCWHTDLLQAWYITTAYDCFICMVCMRELHLGHMLLTLQTLWKPHSRRQVQCTANYSYLDWLDSGTMLSAILAASHCWPLDAGTFCKHWSGVGRSPAPGESASGKPADDCV